jgi:hypothetical protein
VRRIANFAVALDSTLEAIREIDYRRGLKAGAKMQTPKIDKLLASGWHLTVSTMNDGKFHATVHLGRRHGPDSYHHINNTLAEAIYGLELYTERAEDSASRTSDDS